MNKEINFVCPEGATPLIQEEMQKIEGGTVTIANSTAYLNKSTCQQLAAEYVRYGAVTGMTALEVAQEIYAHAYVYYNWQALEDLPLAGEIYESAADGIHIQDGGDTGVRKAFYALVWNTF